MCKNLLFSVLSNLYRGIRFNISIITKFIFMFIAAGICSKMAIKLAYLERGYSAVGGEFLVFPAVFMLGYILLFVIPDAFEWFE